MNNNNIMVYNTHQYSTYKYYTRIINMDKLYNNFNHWGTELYIDRNVSVDKNNITNIIFDLLKTNLSEPTYYEIFKDAVIYEWDNNIIIIYINDYDFQISITGCSLIGNNFDSNIIIDILSESEYFTLSLNRHDNLVPIKYAFPGPSGIQITYRDFEKQNLIEENYSQDVIQKFKKLNEDIDSKSNGLIIFNGPPGTGKTHLIRSLMTECKDSKDSMICIPPLDFLQNISLLTQAISSSDASLVVLEDLGDILTKKSYSDHVQVYSNLLNITDGLLSLLSNALVVLTFNTDIGDISEALLRPGRCISHIEIKELPKSQAKQLLEKDGLGHLELNKKEYTLAEIYEIRRQGCIPDSVEMVNKPIGFVKNRNE